MDHAVKCDLASRLPPQPGTHRVPRRPAGGKSVHPLGHPDMPLFSRWPLFDRVLVNLIDGSAVDGLLIGQRGPLIVLSDCTLYSASTEPAPLDGEVYIERDRVLYIQTAPPKGG